MKISRYFLLSITLTLVFFFIPFLWLKPGEMDLGGDNSRLYFYSPIGYLVSQSLYSVSHSGFGAENLSYYAIPFFILLSLVKTLVQSPTILISIFHGINLSLGFFFCYLTLRELLKNDYTHKKSHEFVLEIASILAGLYYSFSPNPIHWWGYPLLPMNVVFLNPIMFYFLLRFFLTSKTKYLLISLLITFLFSPNFSYIGTPTFFSFFPLAVLFLLIFTKYIKKRSVPVGKIGLGIVLFILLHSFHLVPQILSILTPGSFANEFIFGDQGKLQWGLKYFQATAPSIRVSNALLGLLQYTPSELYWWMYVVYPILFVLGFLWSKSKLFCLSTVFFLIALFFVSANITHVGFKLYTLAFQLPGFSMFRVFYGQWQWSYLFFYTLVVGQALAIVIPKIINPYRQVFLGLLVILFLVTSIPFISGKLTDTTLWQSKDIKSHVNIDPQYDEVLSYIRALPVDGKILSLPLNDHGYQVLKGINDAAYVGPSTITYVAARNEFTSSAEFDVFGPILLAAARSEDYGMFKDILKLLNIKYIFYNSNPYIYTDNFPGFPYTHARNFFPDTQEGYKQFIQNLGVKEVQSFGDTYHIYEIIDTDYLPHIYTAKTIAYWNDIIAANPHAPLSFFEDSRVALFDSANIYNTNKNIFDTVFVNAKNMSGIFDFFKRKKEDRFVSPTVSRHLSSPIYPLVVLKENQDLKKYKSVNEAFIDRSIYFAEKRINELAKLKNIPLLKDITSISELKTKWEEPKLWEFSKYAEYNSWEVTLARYQHAMQKLISEIDSANQTAYSNVTNKVELKVYLKEHKLKLRTALRENSSLTDDDRRYLSSLIENMFVDIYNSLNLVFPDFSNISFAADHIADDGSYEVYISKNDVKNLRIGLQIDGSVLSPVSEDDEWIRFQDIAIKERESLPIAFSIIDLPNLTDQTSWTSAEQIIPKKMFSQDTDEVALTIPLEFLNDTSGIVREIPEWTGNSMYAISFDYKTDDQNFSVVLHEKGGSRTNTYVNSAYEETIRSSSWRQFRIAVLASKDADYASLQVTKSFDDVANKDKNMVKKIEIKNLVVQKIYNPRIVLKKVANVNLEEPQISFTQINPTKYKVTVRGAKDPFTLVFLQAFNQKWKLFYLNQEHASKKLKGIITGAIGSLLSQINNILMPSFSEDANMSVVATYPGNITEYKHRKEFWNKSLFETWGMDPIAEGTHLPVNGYANSWHIKPEDVGNREDYELIIEMTSQKIFIGSLFISGLGLFIMILVCIKSFTKRHT